MQNGWQHGKYEDSDDEAETLSNNEISIRKNTNRTLRGKGKSFATLAETAGTETGAGTVEAIVDPDADVDAGVESVTDVGADSGAEVFAVESDANSGADGAATAVGWELDVAATASEADTGVASDATSDVSGHSGFRSETMAMNVAHIVSSWLNSWASTTRSGSLKNSATSSFRGTTSTSVARREALVPLSGASMSEQDSVGDGGEGGTTGLTVVSSDSTEGTQPVAPMPEQDSVGDGGEGGTTGLTVVSSDSTKGTQPVASSFWLSVCNTEVESFTGGLGSLEGGWGWVSS
ncbi:uncharacterized protein STEHIDRAFT_109648 [Stereum hirsutum FP-91666 SS1]|uniref:uncharacterized protein n=1 Tax=Stereum hirsutum (strain FP-91666) TaxID=721885 RepID=UPI000440FBF8|nr:uncharacterized protein STEHIDRAFT_109648 [Stereum hirsutum FP-91666 SS1]EIM87764.1 hypothetical protein STEHIDRAFT_109648 [Stereum hirsutum FP-91666 SS1]